jgi:HEPN domain-containing protein
MDKKETYIFKGVVLTVIFRHEIEFDTYSVYYSFNDVNLTGLENSNNIRSIDEAKQSVETYLNNNPVVLYSHQINMKSNTEAYEEWILQSNYDFETAEAMFKTGRYVYTVFMCHLSIEKVIKARYVKTLNKVPPKSHNLLWLAEEIKLEFTDNFSKFVFQLNDASLPTRYPQELKVAIKYYSKDVTEQILKKTKELQKWIIQQ